MAEGEAAVSPKKSDLGVRTASALVMVAVAGTALWLGGWVWTAFVVAVALGVLWEWRSLVVRFVETPIRRGLWNAGGLVYIGLAAAMLYLLRARGAGGDAGGGDLPMVLYVVLAVIATDIGAYFAGRTFGGPKIAPRISPSKTWAGLLGGMACAGIVLWIALERSGAVIDVQPVWMIALPTGAVMAAIAQAGDFFESWMKRRAGVKDSGRLIPGHGGLFDRVDGLLAVLFAMALLASHALFMAE